MCKIVCRNHRLLVILFLFTFLISFTVNAVHLKESNLPIVVINTNGAEIKDEPKIMAYMTIYWTPAEMNSVSDATTNYDGYIGIEYRGNSSQRWPKKPYKVETRNASGDNLNISLLGLPKENDWVFYAPYVDKTLLRNALLYRVLNEMGWYAPRYRYCELIINDDYKGVYLLVESLKVDENRIDIKKTSANDVSSSYLLELTTSNRLGPDEPSFSTEIAEQVMAIKYPKDEDLSSAQSDYITDYLNDFEKALYNKQYSGEKDYKNYIDVESFIDHMLVSEVFRQLDAFCASHHFYKDSAGLLVMGPGWDYNRSIGNYKGHETWRTSGLWLTSPRGGCKPFWPEYIYKDASFMTPYKERYAELRDNVLSIGHINSIIDEYSTYIDQAKDRNFEVWDINKNTSHKYVQGSYKGEIDYMKNWLKERLAWLDNQWAVTHHPLINELYADGEGEGAQWVELYNPSGTTLDISGWIFTLNNESYSFPASSIILGNGYLVLTSDKVKFMNKYGGVPNLYGGLKGNLLNDSISITLQNRSAVVKDEIITSVSEGWPIVSKSGNYAVGMRSIAYDNSIGANWNWSVGAGGSPGAANEIFDYTGLRISEIMSANNSAYADEHNEFDDWIELTNTTNYTINLTGLFLSDEVHNLGRWQISDTENLENTLLEPGKSMIIWLDDNAETQGNLHANFSVQSAGERVILSYFDGYTNKLIDQVNPPALGANQSYQLMDALTNKWLVSENFTPGTFGQNATSSESLAYSELSHLKVYPNPVKSDFNVDFHIHHSQNISIRVMDYTGRTLMQLMSKKHLYEGHYRYTFTLGEDVPEGIYILHISGDGFSGNTKLIVVR